MKWWLFSLAWLLIIGTYIMLQLSPTRCDTTSIQLNDGRTVQAELARTMAEHAKGLSKRTSLPAQHGMLFLFNQPGIYGFWMRDTLIPLDIIWLNQGEVVEIATLPAQNDSFIPQHQPSQAANAVLELNAGEAAALGLHPGTTLTWEAPCPNQPIE